MIILKSPAEIRQMRKAGQLLAKVFETLERYIAPGITTRELDVICEEQIRSYGATPSFKGYKGFPGSICVSINEQVVHGIPGNRPLQSGDIVSIDVGLFVDGFHADAARTFGCGGIDFNAERLIQVTRESLERGIEQAVVGNRLSDISYAIQSCVEASGYSVVRDYVGHGIGRSMHEDPQVPNFGAPGFGPRLKEGMTLAIEPMVNMGSYEVVVLSDGWTVVTQDESLSAHFEHTVAITKEGPMVLTEL
jgi:methionyl aminopeptidase